MASSSRRLLLASCVHHRVAESGASSPPRSSLFMDILIRFGQVYLRRAYKRRLRTFHHQPSHQAQNLSEVSRKDCTWSCSRHTKIDTYKFEEQVSHLLMKTETLGTRRLLFLAAYLRSSFALPSRALPSPNSSIFGPVLG